jgi:xanthine dehydrogenase accessory factor
MTPYVLIWGGGDLASGVALRLHRVGICVLIVETHQPMAVRRSVAFAQAVYDGQMNIEEVQGILIENPPQMDSCWKLKQIPMIVDPDLKILDKFRPLVLVDARMRKKKASSSLSMAYLVVGLGPGFEVGENCHAAIETQRGHFLGRVYWQGSPQADTGIPGKVENYTIERVLHTPVSGLVTAFADIGDWVNAGDVIMKVADQEICAPFPGLVRGLIHPGLYVQKGTKVGDIDPRPEVFRYRFVSEKTLAIGGGVLEAILTRESIRHQLWNE